MVDDDALVAGARAGRVRDFEILVERHQRMIHALALRYVGDAATADEVVQTTFLQAFEHLASFGGRAAFRTWLVGIALNAARSLRRTAQAHPTVALDDVPEAALAAATSDDDVLERERLARLVARLPPRQRAVLALRCDADLPFAEIARIEGISENAAKVSYHHAVTRLRAWLATETP